MAKSGSLLRRGVIVALGAFVWPVQAFANVARTPAELTVEDFFRPPVGRDAKLNSAGTHLAMLASETERDSTGIRIIEIDSKKGTGLRGTKAYDIYSFNWVGDERIVYNVSVTNIYAHGLYAIHRDKPTKSTTLNEKDGVQVMGSPRARPNNLLVWIQKSAENEGRPGGLFEFDVRRDSRSDLGINSRPIGAMITPPPGEGVLGWMRDRDGEVRYAITYTKGVPNLQRRTDDGRWAGVDMDLDLYSPLSVDSDPTVLLVARFAPGGASEIVRFNTVDGSAGPALHTDTKYNLGNARILLADDDRRVAGFTYARQAPVQLWFRDEDSVLQQGIDQALPANRVNQIVSRSRDGARLLILSSSDRHPGTFYLFEPGKSILRSIVELAPWLPEHLLGEVRPMNFQARDGLVLDGYVTLPAGHDTGKPAPMVVLPHGGPWARNVWGYDPEAQFLASRGYVVFQPNYRGSSGYNESVSVAPRAEFRRMHDDVTDGARELIKAGIADPNRIAIVGASFGGYLAVCGAAFEPDFYRCAVTIAGVFDWERILSDARQDDPVRYRFDRLVKVIGDPRTQEEKFEAMSPIHFAAEIKIPVFIAHGEEDRVADTGQSRRLARSLEKAGVPHETLFLRDEGHGFAAMKNRVELYGRIEAFLKKNL